ncbi:DUF485 domain-containing protein [Gemmatimonas sp.]|uniref:DUF485 domain-containing protein n=1 Tax=Gemmatimonas sp. TaxID=1962908 RepID=UPI0027B9F512|nr:DUF485 domain-containing protein [Gemmatimonas sp.]
MTPVHGSPISDALQATRVVAAQRWRIAALLTTGMVLVYFGFIALVAFQPQFLATLVSDGLSIGIVLGACVIVSAWVLTWLYISWANRVYDPALAALKAAHGHGEPTDHGRA